MSRISALRIVWKYLKDEKSKLFLYILIVVLTYLPALLAAYFWGHALECLILKDMGGFLKFLLIWSGEYILFYSLLQIPKDKLFNYLTLKFIFNVSKDLYRKVQDLPTIAFEKMGVGELSNRIYGDVERIMDLLNSLIKLICKSFVVIAIVYLSFVTSFVLGIEIIIFGLTMGFISYKFFPKIKSTQKNMKKQTDSYFKLITENITGIREIKALGIKKNIEKNVFSVLSKLVDYNKEIRNYEILYYAFNSLVYYILQFVILFTCGYLFIYGKIQYSIFIMMEMYLWRIDSVVESISDFGVNYNKVIVSLKRIQEIIENKIYSDEKFGDRFLVKSKGKIEFRNVKFKYYQDEDYILSNLNLVIEPNKKIAIVGRSGNGKSTIFNLLLRYFDCNEGQILIDNIDIRELNERSLRNNISVIRQSPFLFNLSIIDNFKLVKEDITLDEVRYFCKQTYIDNYIMSLPNKYDTIIGEGGVNLSGGQKQRLAIARTLLLDTKIILFDEATSALDNESQEYIKQTIDNLSKDHTIIIVAHRLSTIIDADVINVIDKGMLVCSGSHKDLLKNSEIYKNLYLAEDIVNNIV